MHRIYIFVFALLIFQKAYCQSTENLIESNHLYIQGNSILIGNNILGHHSKKPMMEDNIPNDAVKMKYIDVDNDKKTFSSSQASIVHAPKNVEIAYAVLYWSALYPYQKSTLRTSGGVARYIGKGERSTNIDEILFQVPGNDYIEIKGEIVKDEHNNKALSETSPYVCRADVTELLQELPDINGTYTIANVQATVGKIPGGGAAGWVLYIVYEDLNESLKYFTTYDGLIPVDREIVDLEFSKFKSNQKGKINPTLSIAALEGDRKIRTDQMLLYSHKKDEFVPMSNSLRSENNFFISSITMGNELFTDRNPNSSNTLGFDLLKLEIPNSNNQFFNENTVETTLRFQTKADRFYLFFVSFEIEMNLEYLQTINSGLAVEEEVPFEEETDSSDLTAITEDKITETEEEQSMPVVASDIREIKIQNGTRKSRYPHLSESEISELKLDIFSQRNRLVPGLISGYYLVTNVFAVPNNAIHWREFLISKNFMPSTFLNPENDWEYIYIDSFDNLDDGFEAWKEQQDKDYFDGLWLMKVNAETGEISVVF